LGCVKRQIVEGLCSVVEGLCRIVEGLYGVVEGLCKGGKRAKVLIILGSGEFFGRKAEEKLPVVEKNRTQRAKEGNGAQ
jgi:hypothetical protein